MLADDNADMRAYGRRLLVARGYAVTAVADGAAALAACRAVPPDLVLSDVMMPGMDGFGLLRALRAEPALRDVPVILLSARAGAEATAEGLDAGADDYLVKPFSARELLSRVNANIVMARVRRESAEGLRVRTAELETLIETVPVAVWFTHDKEARRISGNRAAAQVLRMDAAANSSLTAPSGERPGHFRALREGTEVPADQMPMQRAARGEEVGGEELEIRFNDGTSRFLMFRARPVRDHAGRVAGAIASAIDVTERRRAEEMLEARVIERTAELAAANRQLLTQIEERERVEATLRQMQRLEAIGQLTSGVAHDFNNLLTVVLGNVEFLLRAPENRADPRLARRLHTIRTAATRGATLTAQLLAFSRRQTLEPRAVDLNDAVRAMRELLNITLGGSVRLVLAPEDGLPSALVDPTQLELVILNLAINARDAMPTGGTVTIETASIRLGAPIRPEDPAAGEYVTVAVRDTGTGMTEPVLARAFEPFFTTKEIGKGSGLGLAQVYGFAKQSGGGVRIETALGTGTSVKVYLPRAGVILEAASCARAPDARGADR